MDYGMSEGAKDFVNDYFKARIGGIEASMKEHPRGGTKTQRMMVRMFKQARQEFLDYWSDYRNQPSKD